MWIQRGNEARNIWALPLDHEGSADSDCLGSIVGADAAQHDFYFTNAVHDSEPDAVWIAVFSFGGVELQRGSRHGDAVCHARAVRTIH